MSYMTYHFTAWLFNNIDMDDIDFIDSAYEVLNDSMIGVSGGYSFVDFSRTASSLDDAMASAEDDLNSLGLTVLRWGGCQ